MTSTAAGSPARPTPPGPPGRPTATPPRRLASRTCARGVATTNAYDSASGLYTVRYSDSTPSLTNIYDRRGRLSSAARNGTTTTLTYNNTDQVLIETNSGGTLAGLALTNGYDAYLRRTSLHLNSQPSALNLSYGYDAASRLSTVSDGAGNQATYSYLANSPLVSQIAFTNSGATGA